MFGVSSNLSQQKSPTAEIFRHIFSGNYHSEKICQEISAVGLFCCDKFEENPNKKVSDLSKLSKPYFKQCSAKLNEVNSGYKKMELKMTFKLTFIYLINLRFRERFSQLRSSDVEY